MRRLLCCLMCLGPVAAFAQRPDSSAVLLVAVTDTLGYPLSGVDVIVTHTTGNATFVGRSDKKGFAYLTVDRTTDPVMVVARGAGFVRRTLAVTLAPSDTTTVLIALAPLSAQELAAVRIEARQSNYFLDSTTFSGTKRLVVDAFDALSKFRPDMLGDRAKCPKNPVENVWVNGKRVWWVVGAPASSGIRMTKRAVGQRVESGDVSGDHGSALQGMLRSIKAEHLAEVRYVNCWDTSLEVSGSDNAVYVVLKNGIGWDWSRGSYVLKPNGR